MIRVLSTSFKENIQTAIGSVRSQKLRATLTVSIIAIGITALVGMITAVKCIERKLSEEFSRLGSNTFSIRSGNGARQGMRKGRSSKNVEVISYAEAKKFQELFRQDATVSLSVFASATATVSRGALKTNPNVSVLGCDANYFDLSSYVLSEGRNFSSFELKDGANVLVCGADIAKELFKGGVSPVGQVVDVNGRSYTIVGVLKEKGNTFGFAGDNQCLIPLTNVRKTFGDENSEYQISVAVKSAKQLESATEKAVEAMRIARSDGPGEANSFEVNMSNGLVEQLMGLISGITLGGICIGIITLISAGIGLMNIMLVSVTERTREIGVRKSIGASAKIIRQQFLIEAIVIGQIGGIIGIVLGVLIGNVVSLVIGVGFTIPWLWLILGASISFLVSVASGYYPAKKASLLDPIEALRYE
jgi:putative ABC transport system permease protein